LFKSADELRYQPETRRPSAHRVRLRCRATSFREQRSGGGSGNGRM